MELALPLLMALLVGVVLGALVGFLLGRRGQTPGAGAEDPRFAEMRHQNEIATVRAEEAAIRNQLDREHLARAGAESARASDAHARLQAQVTGLSARLEGMSDEILRHEERYRDLVDRHRTDAELQKQRDAAESRVLQVLTPVQETLRTMQAKVAEIESQRSLQHGEITQQLRAAADSEERLRSTAESLASALRSNSTRGVWGETQLRSVVEAAGLMQRVDFSTQSSITTDSGAGRPDMVVHLPGGKNIAVDAKVPFNSYLEAAAIPSTASDAELARKATLMRAHVKAVRDHISALGSKTYWEGLDSSPEMVIAFIPSESLVSSALEADPSIMEFAFSKRVALSSPVTLWSVLKTVAFSWQQDVVTAEARSLFDLSKELYGRLATMAGHVSKLGRSLETSVKSYNSFVGSLERQVLPSARRLNALDESKVLSPLEGIEEAPRELTAYELTTRADGGTVDVLAELDAIAPHQPELIDFTAPATPRAEHPKTA